MSSQARDPAPGRSSWVRRAVRVVDSVQFRVTLTAVLLNTLATVGLVAWLVSETDPSTQTHLRPAFTIGIPLVTVASLVVVRWQVGRALAPVEEIRATAERIGLRSGGPGSHRLPVPRYDDELARLTVTMNEMLNRLEAASTKQRSFVSDASHELRSPIATIQALAEVADGILDHPDHPDHTAGGACAAKLAELTGLIGSEVRRLDNLVEDLLALARLDEAATGARRPTITDVDLDELCLAEVERLRTAPAAARGGHDELHVTYGDVGPARVRGSRRQLERLIRNLVDNAARHSNGQISIGSQLNRDGTATVVVCDNGAGVPEELRDQIFDRFSRLDEGRSRDAGGSGIGLALVRAVTEAHNGTVTVDRCPHLGGARFTVTLG